MILSRARIKLDDSGKELPPEGIEAFNLTVNEGYIQQYIAGYIPAHWHGEFEIFRLFSGCVDIGIGDKTYTYHAGEGCFINANVIHSFTARVPERCNYRSFVLDAGIIGSVPGSVFDTKYVRPFAEYGAPIIKFSENDAVDTAFFQAFDRAFTACAEESPAYEFITRAALSEMFLAAHDKSRTAEIQKPPKVQEERLKLMIRRIEDNLDKPLTVRKIADAVNICPRECQRIFKKCLHYSPIEYALRRRIFAAAEQLAATDKSVTEIALTYGFSSPSYFTKQFKALVGVSPAAYRSAVRSSGSDVAHAYDGLTIYGNAYG